MVPGQEEQEPAAPGPEAFEVVGEVADDAAHGRLGVVGLEAVDRLAKVFLADLEQGHAFEGAARAHGVEEEADLAAGPRAELGELDGPRGPHDLGRVSLEKCGLGTRGVVLGQLRDGLEEGAAPLVVEVLAGQLGQRPPGEALANLGHHGLEGLLDPPRAANGFAAINSGRLSHVPLSPPRKG